MFFNIIIIITPDDSRQDLLTICCSYYPITSHKHEKIISTTKENSTGKQTNKTSCNTNAQQMFKANTADDWIKLCIYLILLDVFLVPRHLSLFSSQIITFSIYRVLIIKVYFYFPFYLTALEPIANQLVKRIRKYPHMVNDFTLFRTT